MSNTEEKERGFVFVGINTPVMYTITPHLRYIQEYKKDGGYRKVLQQKWQGTDGSEKWEDVEVVV